MAQIPSIDFSSLELQSNGREGMETLSKSIVDAFSKFGVVKLKGTGLGYRNDVVKNTFQAFKKVFDSSEAEKEKYKMQRNVHGYAILKDAQEAARLNPGHLEEFFNIRGAACTVDDRDQFPWPDDASPGLSQIVKDFMAKCETLSLIVLEAIARGLGLDESDFLKIHDSMTTAESLTTLSVMHGTVAEGSDVNDFWHQHRAAYSTIGLVIEDELDGMQIQNLLDGGYIDAKSGSDDVYVFAGSILRAWTNDMMKFATLRKVITTDKEGNKPPRQTLMYFAASDNNIVVEDLKIGSGEPVEFATATNDEQTTVKKAIDNALSYCIDF